ncbi:hypothetical protein SKAU_G00346230 [Synaphobranchus kaupii]|uniref:Uncharacterized protein n=1 Tax=Synaphobranchus kaupii TaxID=118154 RepID=A0A9Q1IGS0_SYNKA|nr:hypothetical protein SKAU_G00346230 [Synaphobranchus kaupii]
MEHSFGFRGTPASMPICRGRKYVRKQPGSRTDEQAGDYREGLTWCTEPTVEFGGERVKGQGSAHRKLLRGAVWDRLEC